MFPDFLHLPRYLSLGLVLPTYSENHIKANLSDQILQVQCKYLGISSILHSLSLSSSPPPLFPLYSPLSPKYDLTLLLSPLSWVSNIIIGGVRAESPAPPCPPTLFFPPFSALSDRQDHTSSPLDSSTAPCSLLSSCCAVKW